MSIIDWRLPCAANGKPLFFDQNPPIRENVLAAGRVAPLAAARPDWLAGLWSGLHFVDGKRDFRDLWFPGVVHWFQERAVEAADLSPEIRVAANQQSSLNEIWLAKMS